MNEVPMKFDYSKTINEQLPTFNYYKDRYCSYALEIMKLQQENQKYKEIVDKTINAIDLVIELIKQQPTEDDSWILDRLNGFKIILDDKEV